MAEEHADLLLEVGTEEIPARFFPGATEQLESKAAAALREARLDHAGLAVFATPRRLGLLVRGLAGRQADLSQEVRGPAKKTAFDAEGRPTRAAEGFARGQGVAVADLLVKQVEGGEYVFARRTEAGRPALAVLPGLLAGLITGLEWPKSMRWADRSLRFARPIKYLLALYGNAVVPVAVDGIQAGRSLLGHRFLSTRPGPIELQSPDGYQAVLQENAVIADPRVRKEAIWAQVAAAAAALGGTAPRDEDLLDEVNYLVEWPHAFAGRFDPAFLAVPTEVLVTSMREHQRYFPVYREGKLLPNFIAVRNGGDDHLDLVRAGNEKVLRARLTDAKFFFEEDRKHPLEARLEKLKAIVFFENLGTLYEKVERSTALAAAVAEAMGLDAAAVARAARAARLAKADLATAMVYEFPELQGVMGREYALREGEDPAVAAAIFEHYLPRGAGDALPASGPGTAAALADKLDTLAGFFSLGLIPTGSQDPYALRRAAQGVVAILVERAPGLALSDLVALAAAGFPRADRVKLQADLVEFLKARLTVLLRDRGVRYDVVDAVLACGFDRPADAVARAEALGRQLGEADFAAVSTAFRRVANLGAKYEGSAPPDPARFCEAPERELFAACQSFVSRGERLLARADYDGFYRAAVELKGPVDTFLDKILVMVDDAALRNNRLALLSTLARLLSRPADLARLAV